MRPLPLLPADLLEPVLLPLPGLRWCLWDSHCSVQSVQTVHTEQCSALQLSFSPCDATLLYHHNVAVDLIHTCKGLSLFERALCVLLPDTDRTDKTIFHECLVDKRTVNKMKM